MLSYCGVTCDAIAGPARENPVVQTNRHSSSPSNRPYVQGIWRVVLNVGPIEAKTVEYLNGDRFDLRSANLHLIELNP
jgi:hypothetical protein